MRASRVAWHTLIRQSTRRGRPCKRALACHTPAAEGFRGRCGAVRRRRCRRRSFRQATHPWARARCECHPNTPCRCTVSMRPVGEPEGQQGLRLAWLPRGALGGRGSWTTHGVARPTTNLHRAERAGLYRHPRARFRQRARARSWPFGRSCAVRGRGGENALSGACPKNAPSCADLQAPTSVFQPPRENPRTRSPNLT